VNLPRKPTSSLNKARGDNASPSVGCDPKVARSAIFCAGFVDSELGCPNAFLAEEHRGWGMEDLSRAFMRKGCGTPYSALFSGSGAGLDGCPDGGFPRCRGRS